MSHFTILYDHPQEAAWFKSLHPRLKDAAEQGITAARSNPRLAGVLAYDRPDIILLHDERPILVVEETVEVPSGHNVGQRFARIAAAAEARVPFLYFGPYVAKKHGGNTAGPRYMNLRLFRALEAMARVTKSAITTINWPVDSRFEVRRDKDKDADVREYVDTLLSAYETHGLPGANARILESAIHRRSVLERNQFASTSIKRPEQYDGPPDSVDFVPYPQLISKHKELTGKFGAHTEVVRYNVGMKNIRSDPYTGMAMLYKYLYVQEHPSRALVLWFPEITASAWRTAANSRSVRKDIKLFRVAADAIVFRDTCLTRDQL